MNFALLNICSPFLLCCFSCSPSATSCLKSPSPYNCQSESYKPFSVQVKCLVLHKGFTNPDINFSLKCSTLFIYLSSYVNYILNERCWPVHIATTTKSTQAGRKFFSSNKRFLPTYKKGLRTWTHIKSL